MKSNSSFNLFDLDDVEKEVNERSSSRATGNSNEFFKSKNGRTQSTKLSRQERIAQRKSKNTHKDKKSAFYYLKYKNVKNEVEMMGYTITYSSFIQQYVIAGLIGLAYSVLFRLPFALYPFCIVATIFAQTFLMMHKYYNMRHLKRFQDANKYIEKMLTSFKRNRLLLETLKEVITIFPEGEMHEAISSCLNNLSSYDSEISNQSQKEEALKIIETAFPCQRVKMLHKFILIFENEGGSCDEAVEMLAEDRKLWANRTKEAQAKLKSSHMNILISTLLAIALCSFIFYLPGLMGSSFSSININQYAAINIGSVIFYYVILLFYVKTDKKFCNDWLNDLDPISEEDARRRYERVVNYKPTEKFRQTCLHAAVVFAFCFLAYLLTKKIGLLIAGAAIVLFMFKINDFGHNLAVKNLTKKYQIAVPFWIINLSLLLPTENVRTALNDSYESAPNILKPALSELLLALTEYPDDLHSYDSFLSQFDLPDVSECMVTLYGMAIGNVDQSTEGFKDIVNHSNVMMDSAERIKMDDKIAIVKANIALPSLFGCVKMCIDLGAFMLCFFNMPINMG